MDKQTDVDALADEFDGMARAHKAMGDKEEAAKYMMAATALRRPATTEPVRAAVIEECAQACDRLKQYDPNSVKDYGKALRALAPAGGADGPENWRAAEMMRLIDLLRSQEGCSVTICCDNPDFNGQPNCLVICNGDWTGWEDRRFAQDTLLDALSAAMIEYKRPKTSPVAPAGDAGRDRVVDGSCTFPDCRCITVPPCPRYARSPAAPPQPDARIGRTDREGGFNAARMYASEFRTMGEVIRLVDQDIAIMKELEDVPGDTALEKVKKLKEWYQDICTANGYGE